MKHVLTLLILLTIHSSVYAQPKPGQALLDSLLAELPKMKDDTAAVRLLSNISSEYNQINPDEGLKYAARELTLAQKIGWRLGEASAYTDFGHLYFSKGAYPDALNALFETLRIDEELGYKVGIGNVWFTIGNIYHVQKNYPKSLEYYSKALKIAEEQGDKLRIQLALGGIGLVYESQEKYSEALEYKKMALKIAEEMGDKVNIGVQTGNIAGSYANLKQYPAALVYSFKSLRINEEMNNNQGFAIDIGNIGEIYYLIANDSTVPKPDSLVPAGRAANLARAIEYLNKGVTACREAQYPQPIPEFSGYLSNALALQGNYKDAIDAYKVATAVKDSLYNIDNNEKIANLETKRAVELKNKDIQIAKLKKRNERILFTAGFAVLLLIMGILFRSFKKQRQYNALLSKEKKRSDDLLLNILPAEIADELKETGGANARHYEDVSVLFTDFVGFTSAAQLLSPQALVKELHECFTAFDAIAERNGLEKIKTIGDAYMAVCGLPVGDPLHAVKTVQAAIEISAFIEERKKRGGVFRIRIGINSGPVVAGIVGVKKFAYDIWGDTVNTAARMEQHSEPGRVNISQSTYELVKNDYRCNYRGKIAAKNKGEVAMYFVEATVATLA